MATDGCGILQEFQSEFLLKFHSKNPKSFKMPVSENQALKQLGNSVAVNVVKAIGKEIESHLSLYSK